VTYAGQGVVYQGNLTDQLRKIAANTNKVTSVTKELPFWKKMPAIAGSRASPRGAECQWDSSRGCSSVTRGRKRPSVDERMEFRASESESDNVEFRRCHSACDKRRFKGDGGSAMAFGLM
jgi:ribonuclease D